MAEPLRRLELLPPELRLRLGVLVAELQVQAALHRRRLARESLLPSRRSQSQSRSQERSFVRARDRRQQQQQQQQRQRDTGAQTDKSTLRPNLAFFLFSKTKEGAKASAPGLFPLFPTRNQTRRWRGGTQYTETASACKNNRKNAYFTYLH